MDRDAFDGLTRLLVTRPSRRAAIAALLATSLAGPLRDAGAARKRNAGKAKVGAEATCANPGPSANLSGCNFNNDDFSGDDLSGTKLVATTFRNATLISTNVSSSNAKTADFRQANLCKADLRSSTLSGANFNGANLTGANLKSSGGCNTASFNNATTFCGTVMCDGGVRNDDCPGGPVGDLCCADRDCPRPLLCTNGGCACPPPPTSPGCRLACSFGGVFTVKEGCEVCMGDQPSCRRPDKYPPCESSADCAPDALCIVTAEGCAAPGATGLCLVRCAAT